MKMEHSAGLVGLCDGVIAFARSGSTSKRLLECCIGLILLGGWMDDFVYMYTHIFIST